MNKETTIGQGVFVRVGLGLAVALVAAHGKAQAACTAPRSGRAGLGLEQGKPKPTLCRRWRLTALGMQKAAPAR
jgi:hypothetical protein